MNNPIEQVKREIPSVDEIINATWQKLNFKKEFMWKQEVPSAGPNQRIYLITIDEELSENKVEEIMERGLIVFVRDEIKKRFKDNDWVRKLSDLPKEVKI